MPSASPEKVLFNKRAALIQESNGNTQKIIRFFPNTDMRNHHNGLSILAKENNVDVQKLRAGEYVIFTNRRKTHVKMYVANSIIVHQKVPSGSLDLRTIALIPKYFNGTEINFNGAIREALSKALG